MMLYLGCDQGPTQDVRRVMLGTQGGHRIAEDAARKRSGTDGGFVMPLSLESLERLEQFMGRDVSYGPMTDGWPEDVYEPARLLERAGGFAFKFHLLDEFIRHHTECGACGDLSLDPGLSAGGHWIDAAFQLLARFVPLLSRFLQTDIGIASESHLLLDAMEPELDPPQE